jgi:hypothetical protein
MVEEPGVAGREAQAWPTVLLGEVTVHAREGKRLYRPSRVLPTHPWEKGLKREFESPLELMPE